MAVWPCAQTASQWQRRGRYLAASNAHPAKMLPELARRAIETYSDPGDLVLDPMCGIGTTLIEAIHLGREAIGVEIEQRWARLASANIRHARREGAPGHAQVIRGDARELQRLLAGRRQRAAGLLLTSPRYGDASLGDPCAGQGIARARECEGRRLTAADRTRARRRCRACHYGPARGSLARLPHRRAGLLLTSPPRPAAESYLAAMGDIYRQCAAVLKPGGFLVLVTKGMRRDGRLRDLAAETIALCQGAGLTYWQHVIALHAAVRDGQLHPRASFWRAQHYRQALAHGQRPSLPCHEDVLIFRACGEGPPRRTPETTAACGGRTRRHARPVPHPEGRGVSGRQPSRLSVWPVAQSPARIQRRGRYLPASTAHPGKMLPALARTAIERYSDPGELILDPMCGIGTTLIEAIHTGRQAIGVELEGRWAALAAENVTHARQQGAPGRALVQPGDARDLGRGLLDAHAGKVALILTSPPYGPSTHGVVTQREGKLEKRDWSYGQDHANLARLPAQAGPRGGRPGFTDALGEILNGCRRMLAPDGHLVISARAYRKHGQLVDLPGQLSTLAKQAGFVLHDRQVALLCGLREQRLVPRATFFQLRWARTGRFPRMQIIAHEDVLVFTPRRKAVRARGEAVQQTA